MEILYQQNPNNAEQLIGPNKMVNGQMSNLYSADEVINYIVREAQAGSFPKAISVPYNDKNARVFVFRNDEDVLRIVMSQKDPRVVALDSVTKIGRAHV